MKICGVVITYNPEPEEIKENILRYLPGVEHLVIWRNSDTEADREIENTFQSLSPKISFMGYGENKGIGYALNRVAEKAKLDGYTHILTMDQDSYWEDFNKYRQHVEALADKDMIFSPNVNNEYPAITQHNPYTITSGSIFNLALFDKIGGFKENYFIDGVDTEFCLRASKNGYPTTMIGECNLIQNFGNRIRGKLYVITPYNAFRRYHIVRNHIWIWREYGKAVPASLKQWLLKQILKEPVKIIVSESDKLKKINAIVKGVKHGLFKNPSGSPQ